PSQKRIRGAQGQGARTRRAGQEVPDEDGHALAGGPDHRGRGDLRGVPDRGPAAHLDAAQPGAVNRAAAEIRKTIELLVVADKFQNTRVGHTYLYDAEIYIDVRKKYEEKTKQEIEANKAQIRQDLRTIFGRAEPTQLLEPTLATLTRQIHAVLDERL